MTRAQPLHEPDRVCGDRRCGRSNWGVLPRSIALAIVGGLFGCNAAPNTSVDASADARPADVAAVDATLSVPHRGFPLITDHGGNKLTSMRLVVIVAPGDPLATQLFEFCDVLVHSQWWTTVSVEYGIGMPTGCVHLTGAPLAAPATPDDPALQHYIANAIAASSMPVQPDGQTVYGSSAGLATSEVLRGVRDRGRAGNDPDL